MHGALPIPSGGAGSAPARAEYRHGSPGRDTMADADGALMQAFQRGDIAAFETLVERHRDRVFRLAFRYLGEASAAEDLAQETFLRVYRTRHTWRPEARFSTWLHRVTANACLNEIRARKARRGVETTARPGPDGAASPEPADARLPSPPQAAERSETAGLVREAVARLPDDQRLAVILSKFDGLSSGELADAMGRSVPAVKSLLVRARENLRRALSPHLSGLPGGSIDGSPGSGDDDAEARARKVRDRRVGRTSGPGGPAPGAGRDGAKETR
jgi:RNA polymerase sigma-70 factor (ECF subfamily)